MIPARYVTVDGYPLPVGDLETSSTVNLGYDQFRANTTREALARLPWTTTLGSIVTVYDATGTVIWQGRMSTAPRIEADGMVRLAAQGHGYQAVKSVRRLPVKVTSVNGWTVGNTSPLDFVQVAGAQPTVTYSKSSGRLVNNQVALSFSSALEASVAYYAPGAAIRMITWAAFTVTSGETIRVYGSRGPNFNADRVLIAEGDYADLLAGGRVAIPDNDFDTIVFDFVFSSPASGSAVIRSPIVWGRQLYGSLMSHDIARAIGAMMDWDVTTVDPVGEVVWPSFDWAADVASGLTQATIPEDLRWLLLDDRGYGPVLDFGGWTRTWEVSGAEGAVWSLDPLERYTKVIVQYLDDLGKARAVTASIVDPELFRVVNELQTVAPALQSVDEPGDLPDIMAANILDFATTERWRGSVTASRVRESGTGMTGLYHPRAGDLVRITDFSPTDGAVTLRIADLTQTDDAIVMGISAPSFAAGSLSTSSEGETRGTFRQIDPDAYAPAGAPGSTAPVGGGPPGVPIIIGDWKGGRPGPPL